MLHDEGCIGNTSTVTDEMIDQMNRDLADVQRCESELTAEELEQMRLDNMTPAESREYCLAIVREMRQVTQRIMAKNQARRTGKAVVA